MQLDELKTNFVAIASHELRTPATSVYGVLTTLLERDGQLDEDLRRELLRVGVEQGERLRRLLEELLDLSRLDARGVSVKPRPLVLASVLSEIVSEALPTGATVEIDVPDDLVVVADRLVLDRVVSNLLINAAALRRRADHVVGGGGRYASPDHGRGQRRGRFRGDAPPLVRTLRTHRFGERRQRARPCDRPHLRPCARRRPCLRPGGERGARFELIIPQL